MVLGSPVLIEPTETQYLRVDYIRSTGIFMSRQLPRISDSVNGVAASGAVWFSVYLLRSDKIGSVFTESLLLSE
jgi:hypothetical protein